MISVVVGASGQVECEYFVLFVDGLLAELRDSAKDIRFSAVMENSGENVFTYYMSASFSNKGL